MRILFNLAILLFILGVEIPVFVQAQEVSDKAEVFGQMEAINVGNKICPVSGEKIGQGGLAPATYEYQGKVYNLCCPACVDEFKKDPDKYIEKVGKELQAQSKEVANKGEAISESGMSMSGHSLDY